MCLSVILSYRYLRKVRNLIAVISFLLFSSYLYAQDDFESRGPLQSRGYTIFQLSAFEFTTPLPTHLGEDSILVQNAATWTNVFNVPHGGKPIVDSELLRFDNRVWYGVTDRLSVGVSLPITIVGGGVMDPFIEGFHNIFGFNNDTRYKYPRNDFSVDKTGYSADLLISDLTIHARYRLFDNPGISVGLRLQTPSLIATDWFNHHQIGVGIDVTAFYNVDSDIGNFHFTAMATVAHLGDTTAFGYSVTQHQTSFLLGVDWKASDDFSIILQLVATSGNVDVREYMKPSFEIAAGIRLYVTERVWVDVGATENMVNLENSADFGAHIGLNIKY